MSTKIEEEIANVLLGDTPAGEPATESAETPHPTHLYVHADRNLPREQRMPKLLQSIRDWALGRGCSAETAEKVVRVFDGNNAPCAFTRPRCWLVDIPAILDDEDIVVNRLTGGLAVQPSTGGPEYMIRLNPEGEQHMFAVIIERLGNHEAGAVEPNLFPSFSVVIPETMGTMLQGNVNVEVPALCIALDARGRQRSIIGDDGVPTMKTFYSINFSGRVYLSDPKEGQEDTRQINRLSTVGGRNNLEGRISLGIVKAGWSDLLEKAHVISAEATRYGGSGRNRRDDLRNRASSATAVGTVAQAAQNALVDPVAS